MCAQRFQCNHVYLSDKLLLEGARTLVQEGEGCDHAHTERLTNVEGSLKVMLLHLPTPDGNPVHMDVENKSGRHNYNIYIYIAIYTGSRWQISCFHWVFVRQRHRSFADFAPPHPS